MAERKESHMGEAMASTVRTVQKMMTGQVGEMPTAGTVDQPWADAILDTWESKPQEVARTMIQRYGLPNEATESRFIWYNSGPWKRTIVYRDELPHNFPKPHTDLLEQFINYQVPLDKFNALAAFDGSVIAERTKGEISARCDMEEMNFLAINLAHDVAIEVRTIDEAREMYAETAGKFMAGQAEPYTQGIQFTLPQGDTTDKDATTITDTMMSMLKERMTQQG